MIKNINYPNEFHEAVATGKFILVDFYADWCEPCKWLDVILKEIDERGVVDVEILKVNTDTHLDLTHELNLKSVPVLMVFKEGKLSWRMTGFLTTDEMIEKLLSISRETE